MAGVPIRVWIFTVIVAAVFAGNGSSAVEYTPERYQVILDRSPFGEDPLDPGLVAQKQAVAAAKTLAKDLRLCFLLEDNDGQVRAGFQNLKPKAGEPKSVMLLEGESFNGMKLLDIDLPESAATLLFQGKPITFNLSKAPAPAAARKAPTRPTTASKAQTRRFGSGFKKRTPPPKPPKQAPLSLEEQARIRAETRANLQQYQMEVIRAGMPPLPIPLTQEMDDQLVAEGVLEPSLPE